MLKRTKKVIVGMSGGVDSSVAAYLLKQKGYYVEGVFIKSWEEDDNEKHCSSASDLADAQAVCDIINIKLHTVNFSEEYWNNVFRNFLIEYSNGRTPNPDILCNKEIKFRAFLKFSIENLNANYIATGHYVRCVHINNRIQLLRGLDKKQDQSYFLYALRHKQLAKSLFPIGNLEKKNVRKIANEIKFVNANKKNSTGICFIGTSKFQQFLSRYIPAKPGKIISINGDEIGKHKGIMYYTIGQRKGLGIGGIKKNINNPCPWYVVSKDIQHNLLIVAQCRNHPRLMSIGLIANRIHWIDQTLINNIVRCTIKTRYNQLDIPCTMKILSKNQIKVIFDNTIFAVTPGQSAVFYKEKICLGGGIIEKGLKLNR